MKILNKLIVLYLISCLPAKKIVPQSTATKHQKILNKQRKAQSASCYEHCRQQQQQQQQHHSSGQSQTHFATGQTEVYHDTLNKPEHHDENWEPKGLFKHVYNRFKDILKTGTILSSEALGATIQMQNDMHQAEARMRYNQQLQEQQLERQKLYNDAQLQEDTIKINDQLYKDQQRSPYYQQQQQVQMNKKKRLVRIV